MYIYFCICRCIFTCIYTHTYICICSYLLCSYLYTCNMALISGTHSVASSLSSWAAFGPCGQAAHSALWWQHHSAARNLCSGPCTCFIRGDTVALGPGVRDLNGVAMVMAHPHLPSMLCLFWITSPRLEVQLCAHTGHMQIILGVWAVVLISLHNCSSYTHAHAHTHTHTHSSYSTWVVLGLHEYLSSGCYN